MKQIMNNFLTIKENCSNSKERGSAIIVVMFMVGLVLTLITIYTHNEGVMQKVQSSQKMRDKRDQVAKKLVGYLNNHQIVKGSGGAAFASLGSGNQLLYNCLNATKVGGKGCRSFPTRADKDKKGYYDYPQLVIVPPDGFAFPSDKSGGKNCPGKKHASCYLSGESPANVKVGYNFEGETGVLSECFPLEPIVYINPDCGSDDVGNIKTTCDLAQDIRLGYQLVHRKFGSECEELPQGLRGLSLAATPKEPGFVTLPRHTLVDYECNAGAYVKGYEGGGDILCECQFPWVPVEGQRNERGIICQEIKDTCPTGSVFVGRDGNGQPVCKMRNQMTQPFTESMQIGTSNFRGNIAGGDITCGEHGWLQDLQVSCQGRQRTVGEIGQQGFSCLLFYGIVKAIDGEFLIPGLVPTIFYPGGERPCIALSETLTVRPPQTVFDFGCLAATTTLLYMASGATGLLKKAVLKTASKTVVTKAMGKIVGKTAAKVAATNASKALGLKLSKAALTKLGNNASKAAIKAGALEAEKLAKQGLSQKLIKEGARKAATRAASESATAALEKSFAKAQSAAAKTASKEASAKTAKDLAEKGLSSEAIAKAAKEAGESAGKAESKAFLERAGVKKVGSETLDRGVFNHIAMQISGGVTNKLAQQGLIQVKNTAGKGFKNVITRTKTAAKRLQNRIAKSDAMLKAKSALKSSPLIAAGYGSVGANLLLGDLSPELFAATLAQDVAIDAAGIAARQLLAIPYGVGVALYHLSILASALLFASMAVQVDYNCYPLTEAPAFACTLSGTCYDYDHSVN